MTGIAGYIQGGSWSGGGVKVPPPEGPTGILTIGLIKADTESG